MSQLVCYICFDNCRLIFNGHILFVGQGGLCVYISFLFSREMIEQHLVSSSWKIVSFFFYKNKKLIFVRVRALVFRRFGDLSLYTIGTNGLSYLGREAQSNFPTSAVGRFLSKDSIYALQLRLYLSSLNLFSCAYCML